MKIYKTIILAASIIAAEGTYASNDNNAPQLAGGIVQQAVNTAEARLKANQAT